MPRDSESSGADGEARGSQLLVVADASGERLRRAFRRRGRGAIRSPAVSAVEAITPATECVVIATGRGEALEICRRIKTRHQFPPLPVLVLARRPRHGAWAAASPDAWLPPDAPLAEIVGRAEELVRLRHAMEEPARLSQALAVLAAENGRLHDRARRDADATSQLLRELQHRVRNNLATVQALLVLERHRSPARALSEALDAAIGRLHSLAMLQDLTRFDSSPTHVAELASRLARGVAQMFAPASGVQFVTDGDAIVGPEASGSLAIALHELLANALVSAGATSVVVRVRERRGAVHVCVEDDGRGMPAPPHAGSGLLIARTVVRNELNGTLSFQALPAGTRARLELPRDAAKPPARYAACAEPSRAPGCEGAPGRTDSTEGDTMDDTKQPRADSAAERAHGTHGKGDDREERDEPSPIRPGNERVRAGERVSPDTAGELADAGWGSSAAGGSVSDKRSPEK